MISRVGQVDGTIDAYLVPLAVAAVSEIIIQKKPHSIMVRFTQYLTKVVPQPVHTPIQQSSFDISQ